LFLRVSIELVSKHRGLVILIHRLCIIGPRWLVQKDNIEKARRSLLRVREVEEVEAELQTVSNNIIKPKNLILLTQKLNRLWLPFNGKKKTQPTLLRSFGSISQFAIVSVCIIYLFISEIVLLTK
jgi:hypothetical protein